MNHWLITTVVSLHVKKHGALWDLVKGEMSLVKPKLRDEAKRSSSPGKPCAQPVGKCQMMRPLCKSGLAVNKLGVHLLYDLFHPQALT